MTAAGSCACFRVLPVKAVMSVNQIKRREIRCHNGERYNRM
jgi:hypothetical protein